jgi:hypothetical protein
MISEYCSASSDSCHDDDQSVDNPLAKLGLWRVRFVEMRLIELHRYPLVPDSVGLSDGPPVQMLAHVSDRELFVVRFVLPVEKTAFVFVIRTRCSENIVLKLSLASPVAYPYRTCFDQYERGSPSTFSPT